MKRQTQLSLVFSVMLLLLSILIPAFIGFCGYSSFCDLFWASVYYYLHGNCIKIGTLTIIDKSSLLKTPTTYEFGNGLSPRATIEIESSFMFQTVLLKGDIGLGESYVHRQWQTNDLESYLRILFLNWNNFQSYLSIIDWLSIPMWNEFSRLYSYQHTINQDKESIELHYDTGIELFKLFLDPPTMVYTSAMFNNTIINKFDKKKLDNINYNVQNIAIDDKDTTLNDNEIIELLSMSQENKINRVINKANINENDTILDIGCGFGYLASSVLKNTNAKDVYGITLSNDQLSYAMNRYKNNDNLHFILSDYRDFMSNKSNIFDAIFSIEMVEAIGKSQLNTYFNVVSRLLKESKRFVIQFIGYTPWAFPKLYKQNTNGQYYDVIPTFVTKYIFPSGFVPNPSDIHEAASMNGLDLIHSESFGKHYALTLALWRRRLYYNKNKIILLFGENTFYTFDYYLAWCQALYRAEIINNWQFVFEKRDSNDGNLQDIGGQNFSDLLFSI